MIEKKLDRLFLTIGGRAGSYTLSSSSFCKKFYYRDFKKVYLILISCFVTLLNCYLCIMIILILSKAIIFIVLKCLKYLFKQNVIPTKHPSFDFYFKKSKMVYSR